MLHFSLKQSLFKSAFPNVGQISTNAGFFSRLWPCPPWSFSSRPLPSSEPGQWTVSALGGFYEKTSSSSGGFLVEFSNKARPWQFHMSTGYASYHKSNSGTASLSILSIKCSFMCVYYVPETEQNFEVFFFLALLSFNWYNMCKLRQIACWFDTYTVALADTCIISHFFFVVRTFNIYSLSPW